MFKTLYYTVHITLYVTFQTYLQLCFKQMFLYTKLFYQTHAFKPFYRLTSSRSFLKNNTYISNVLQNLFMLLYYKLHASMCMVI